ncbi:MAG: methylated-DNA--[protein]-cysteine S-methyltransferase [Methanobrevibacter sp.]|jgi:methylated-DNA-[protein]-cysteine S-methyltransferase|nr:methylated-DNA--[protein]-cysteine S-methyltransferase [Methanobrevibacter sp.]
MKIKAFCKGNKLVKVAFEYEFEEFEDEELFFQGYELCEGKLKDKLIDAFNGKDVDFSDNLDFDLLDRTDFEKEVLKATFTIPKGEIKTYKEVAESLGSKGYRAVGNALNKNPVAIAIPCHRVVGSDKGLRGFRGGIGMKKEMLMNEGFKFKKDKLILK